jgi:hypothetical protein
MLGHPRDVRLAPGIEPRVVPGDRLVVGADRADAGHLPGEGDARDIAGPPRLGDRAADRPMRRVLDVRELLLHAARPWLAQGDLLEGLAEHLAGLVHHRRLGAERPKVAADEDGHWITPRIACFR